MITCHIRYTIDPYKLDDFERYARAWIPLVNRLGGEHHGFFLPQDGANDVSFGLFSFPSLGAYEEYRGRVDTDEECHTSQKRGTSAPGVHHTWSSLESLVSYCLRAWGCRGASAEWPFSKATFPKEIHGYSRERAVTVALVVSVI